MESIIILGLGNILYADEGFGVRAAERLYSRHVFPENVEIVDAGTQGHPLLTFVERADRMLLLDAVDFGLPPGSLTLRDSSGIPAYLTAHKMSLHQNSFSEVLALAELKDCLPRELKLIGLQPADLSYGGSLSLPALEKLEEVEQLALEQLAAWNVFPLPRAGGASQRQFQSPAISIECFNN